jgi:serine/threonine protein kinase
MEFNFRAPEVESHTLAAARSSDGSVTKASDAQGQAHCVDRTWKHCTFSFGQMQGRQTNNISTRSGRSLRDGSLFYPVKRLGTGAFSLVDEVRHLITNVRLARKVSATRKYSSGDHFMPEIRALKALKHRHIIRLVDAIFYEHTTILLLSPVAETNLAGYLAAFIPGQVKTENCLKGFFGCLVSAVRYIHESSLMHGDIKPANILIGGETPPNVFLCDFGASGSNADTQATQGGKWQLTWRYAAPETASHQSRGSHSDVFSLGCVFFEMAGALFSQPGQQLEIFRQEFGHRKYFYKELSSVRNWLKKLKTQAAPESRYILDAISSMVRRDPLNRPTAAMLSSGFPPHACCIAWPGTEVVHTGSVPGTLLLALITSASTGYLPRAGTFRGETSQCGTSIKPLLKVQNFVESFARLCAAKEQAQTQNPSTEQLATNWLRICQYSHRSCSQPQSGFLPRFLLEIDGKQSARLICTSTVSISDTRYVALSYMWGPSPQLRLSKANKELLHQAVDVRSLAGPVESAIAFVGKVGLKYLWVDTLCIVEDDEKCNQEQMALMGQIYAKAFLVISALDSKQEHGQLKTSLGSPPRQDWNYGSNGLPNVLSVIAKFERAWSMQGGSPGHLSAVRSVGRNVELALLGDKDTREEALTRLYPSPIYHAAARGDVKLLGLLLEEEVRRSAGFADCVSGLGSTYSYMVQQWSSRAFTYQEALLSPRRLVFTKSKVYFQCRELEATETFPGGLSPLLWESIHQRGDLSGHCTCPAFDPSPFEGWLVSHQDLELYDLWSAIVSRQSSNPWSKLDVGQKSSAIAGSARLLSTVLRDEFLGGLWERSLPWTLPWHVVGENDAEDALERKSLGPLPSWSWLGSAGAVEIPTYTRGRALSRISKADTHPGPRDMIWRGLIDQASLRICGPLSKATFLPGTTEVSVPIPIRGISKNVTGSGLLDDKSEYEKHSRDYYVLWTWMTEVETGEPSLSGILVMQEPAGKSFLRCGRMHCHLGDGTYEDLDWTMTDITLI